MNLPATMLAAVATREGGPPPVLTIETVPVPRPAAGQVLVRVESAAVNFSDVKRRRGDAYPFPTAFPFVPGGEIAGTVAAVGPGVTGFAEGDAVFGLCGGDGQGGCAQFALAQAAQVAPIPGTLDADRASAITIAGTTALLLLRHAAALRAGETVLVPAPVGGVGTFLLQLARRLGARTVIAATRDEGKFAQARALGASAAVCTADPGWPDAVRRLTDGRGVDVLLEASGGATLGQGLRCLAPFGRAVVYGSASGHDAALDPATLRRLLYAPAPNQSLHGFNVGGWFLERPEVAGAALGEIVGRVASGEIAAPPIEARPLSQAALVHERLATGRTAGKVVLKPWAA